MCTIFDNCHEGDGLQMKVSVAGIGQGTLGLYLDTQGKVRYPVHIFVTLSALCLESGINSRCLMSQLHYQSNKVVQALV